MARVATILPSAPVGLLVARRGGPDPMVSERNCDGGRRQTMAENDKRRRTTADDDGQWEILFDSVG